MDFRYSPRTCAYALLREQWRWYDAGGHSMRSPRALLLETILQPVDQNVRLMIGLDMLAPVRARVRKERQERGPYQPMFDFGLPYLSDDEFAHVIIIAICISHQHDGGGLRERLVFAAAALLLGVREDHPQYKKLAISIGLEGLLAEGRRRQERRWGRERDYL